MALLTAPGSTPFDNLAASSGAVIARSETSATLSFSPVGSKLGYTLKLTGAFDTSGRLTQLDQAVYTLPDASAVPISFSLNGAAPLLDLAQNPLRVDRLMVQLFGEADVFTLGSAADALNAGAGDDIVIANDGADRVMGGAGNDALNGGRGIDTAVYAGRRTDFEIKPAEAAWTVTARQGDEGTDTLVEVERLRFADIGVALDLAGHAGTVAKLLGAVFGAKALGNREYVGIGLDYLDRGTSPADLAALAVSVTGKSAPRDVVDLLWGNVIGGTPSDAQARPFVDMLQGGMSIGQLALAAAESVQNVEQIDLVGLAKTGLEFG